MNLLIRSQIVRYITGFVLSVVLTVTAFWLVSSAALHGSSLLWALSGLALVQLVVQLLFFLHIASEKGPRWNLMSFLFMILVMVVVVGGSIWIMKNLDYNMMTPTEGSQYIESESDGGF